MEYLSGVFYRKLMVLRVSDSLMTSIYELEDATPLLHINKKHTSISPTAGIKPTPRVTAGHSPVTPPTEVVYFKDINNCLLFIYSISKLFIIYFFIKKT